MNKSKKSNLSAISFIMISLGAAIGFRNLARFPMYLNRHGGAAFMLPYILAIIVLGLPILIMELNFANKWQKGNIKLFDEWYGNKGRILGWTQAFICWTIAAMGLTLIAWSIISFFISFTSNLGTTNFFFGQILGVTVSNSSKINNMQAVGSVSIYALLGTIVALLIGFVILAQGVKKGIAKVNLIVMPVFFVMLLVLVIYALTLTGADIGLDKMFYPDLKKLLRFAPWKDAFMHAFYTLGIGLGMIFVFSKQTVQKSDLTNKAIIIVCTDTLVSIIGSMIIFTAMGHLALVGNKNIVDIVGDAGPALIFEIFPRFFKIINSNVFQGLGNVLALMFFLAMFCTGISTFIGLAEVGVDGLQENKRWTRKQALLFAFAFIVPIAMIYALNHGNWVIFWVDYWTVVILTLCLLLQIVFFISNKQNFNLMVEYNNQYSRIKLLKWFYWYIAIFTVMMIVGICFAAGYDIYEQIVPNKGTPFLIIFGFIVGLLMPLGMALLFSVKDWSKFTFKKCRYFLKLKR